MTRQAFLKAYRNSLLAAYAWAGDAAKLDHFMASVSATLDGANTWNHTGEAVTAAWHWIGGKGRPTLKALRALPSESALPIASMPSQHAS